MRYDHSVTINRPIQEVWDYASNPQNAPTWNSVILASRKTSDGPMGTGSMMTSTVKLLGRQMEIQTEVTEWNPPNSYGFKSTGGSVEGTVQARLTEEGQGTRFELIAEADLSGIMRLAEPVTEPIIKSHLNTDLETLKTLLENKVPAGAGSS